MAAPLKIDYAFNAEDLESSAKIVKFTMRPTTSPNGCFATKRMRRMSSKRRTYVRLSLLVDSMAPMAEPGC